VADALSRHGVNIYKADDATLMATLNKLTDNKGQPLSPQVKGQLFQKIQVYKQKGGVLQMLLGGLGDTQTPNANSTIAPNQQIQPAGLIPSPNASQQVGGPEDLKRLRAIQDVQRVLNLK